MKQRGFTLIELLVVIAIIGILSAVVLASLNTARSKGSDAAIQSDLEAIRVQAEVYYNDNSTYSQYVTAVTCPTTGTTMWNANTGIKNAIIAADNANGSGKTVRCVSSTNYYVVQAELVNGIGGKTNWCIDSTGAAIANNAPLTIAYSSCPTP